MVLKINEEYMYLQKFYNKTFEINDNGIQVFYCDIGNYKVDIFYKIENNTIKVIMELSNNNIGLNKILINVLNVRIGRNLNKILISNLETYLNIVFDYFRLFKKIIINKNYIEVLFKKINRTVIKYNGNSKKIKKQIFMEGINRLNLDQIDFLWFTLNYLLCNSSVNLEVFNKVVFNEVSSIC